MSSLGRKIKYFRERAGLTQFELELALRTSPGSISRIEKDKTNPTKETLLRLASELNLNKFEIDYLVGPLSEPPSEKELTEAKEEVREYFNRKGVLAYLVDDRYRVVAFSKDFPKLAGLSLEQANNVLMKSLVIVIIDPQYGIFDIINNDGFEDSLRSNLAKYYYEVSFMQGEPEQQEVLKTIYSHPIARKIWKEIIQNPPTSVNTLEGRTVKFSIGKFKINMVYSAEYLSKHQRFVMIEYAPSSRILKLLSKAL